MGELTLTPWRRYGHDRVYVAAGKWKIGYLNRADDTLVLDDEAFRDAAVAALAAAGYLTETRCPAEPRPETAAAPEPWAITLRGDTATYKPGAGARAKAAEERAAAPVRTTLARLLGVHTAERAWRVGAAGEEAVARRLCGLGDEWCVLHDQRIGDRGANVDHVVIGPGGVFTMNTKNLGGTVWVGGDTFLCNRRRERYVPAARAEARRVAALLTRHAGRPVEVTGMLVVIAPRMTVRTQPRDVVVVRDDDVRRWLERRPAVLDPERVRRLERVARDPLTWRGAR